MFAAADTALHRLVLEFLLHALRVGVLGLVLSLLLPVCRWAEDDVFADRGGIVGGSVAVVGRQTKLGPLLALGDAGVDDLAVGDETDAASGFDGLALLVQAVRDGRLGAVAVLDGLIWGQGGGGFLGIVVVVGPVSVGEVCVLKRMWREVAREKESLPGRVVSGSRHSEDDRSSDRRSKRYRMARWWMIRLCVDGL